MGEIRKSGIELRKEYKNKLTTLKALETRIKDRAELFTLKYPDIKINDLVRVGDYTAKELEFGTDICLNIIVVVEKHIADQHPHQQTEMF